LDGSVDFSHSTSTDRLEYRESIIQYASPERIDNVSGRRP
jgi:hypothetical protein